MPLSACAKATTPRKRVLQDVWDHLLIRLLLADDEVVALLEAGINIAFDMYGEIGTGLAAHICQHIEQGRDVGGEVKV